eukprot:CAMPEP_0116543308 /NCGR_PEP_ID=MMETSP0397-20121206/1485_1 /TAXON_ID=216820 /ORGANISM="Cyclophora tenuis, Strain ECT3854" /LENGTH=145 /DNA_ID=CAMNT_0004067385 /DNA_START=769 /DNA_END=1202 /DNA_ORIENTATION=-
MHWRWWVLQITPYLAGIVWICLHPVVSIVTGELKCRGWYIDENSLDPAYFRLNARYSPAKPTLQNVGSMCDALHLWNGGTRDNILCFQHEEYFEIMAVTPISNPITPHAESIALVVPPSTDWISNDFHNSILQLAQHLSSPRDCP